MQRTKRISMSRRNNVQRKPVMVKDVDDSTPPTLDSIMRIGQRCRFQATSEIVNLEIGWLNLRNLMWVATGATAGRTLVQAVRLKHVTVYAPPKLDTSAGVTPDPVRIVLGEGSNAAGARIATMKSKSGAATNLNGCKVGLKVPPDSLSGMWRFLGADLSSSEYAFKLTCPQGSVVDIDLIWQFPLEYEIEGAVGIALVCAGATTGRFYFNYLDGSLYYGGAGGSLLLPIGVENSLTAYSAT